MKAKKPKNSHAYQAKPANQQAAIIGRHNWQDKPTNRQARLAK
jgi:hypothetical protein